MTLFSVSDVKEFARDAYGDAVLKSVGSYLIAGRQKKASSSNVFDIFLSHSYQDASVDSEALLGICIMFERAGLSVYVDWIVDGDLSRQNVTQNTASRLRLRMAQSKCLLFATSSNSSSSKWMPWELGFFDGFKGRVGVMPLTGGASSSYRGQEYLGLYPFLDRTAGVLWMHSASDPSRYIDFKRWMAGMDP